MKVNLKVKILLILGVALIVGRILLPIAGKASINWVLQNKLENYTGSIEDFDLVLLRGAYQLEGLQITKRNTTDRPFISCHRFDVSLAWRALLHGKLTADVLVERATLRLIDDEKKAEKQFGNDEKNENWISALKSILPIHVETLRVHQSEVHFYNNSLKTPLAFVAKEIQLHTEDLRNRGKGKLSPFVFTARLQDKSQISATGEVDILAKPMRADVDLKLREFDLKAVNQLLRSYIPVDVTKGTLDIFAEVATSENSGRGYAKVFLQDTDVIAPRQRFLSGKHFGVEILSGLGNWIFTNYKSGSIASFVPFIWSNGKFNVDTETAIFTALEHKRGRLSRGLENSVDLQDMRKRPVGP